MLYIKTLSIIINNIVIIKRFILAERRKAKGMILVKRLLVMRPSIL